MAESPRPIYADATALIGLSRIDRLNLLALLPTPVLITAHVWREVSHDATKPGDEALRHAVQSGLLAVVDEGNPDRYPELDPGESSVVSAAAAAHAMALLDERRARTLVSRDLTLRGPSHA